MIPLLIIYSLMLLGGFSQPKKENIVNLKQAISQNYYKDIPDSILKKDWLEFEKYLDPYTRVLDSLDMIKFENDFIGRGKGVIGITTDSVKGGHRIIETTSGGSAYDMGIIRGDIIIKVNGKVPKSSEDLGNLISGNIGGNVHLDILRNHKNLKVTLQRGTLFYKSVFCQRLNRTGIINIEKFNNLVSIEFLLNSVKVNPDNVDTLIIDLRNNLGGSLYECLGVTDEFFDEGKVILKRKGNKTVDYDYATEGGKWLDNKTIIVLQNSYSASASELLSGCLKFGRNAVIVGDTSYGKGLVQTRLDVGENIVYVTTSEYFPLGYVKVHGIGILPDKKMKTIRYGKLPDKFDVKLFRKTFPNPSLDALKSPMLKGRKHISHLIWDKDGELFEILLQKPYK